MIHGLPNVGTSVVAYTEFLYFLLFRRTRRPVHYPDVTGKLKRRRKQQQQNKQATETEMTASVLKQDANISSCFLLVLINSVILNLVCVSILKRRRKVGPERESVQSISICRLGSLFYQRVNNLDFYAQSVSRVISGRT